MKKITFQSLLLLSLLLTAAPVFSQQAQVGPLQRGLRAHVEYLASARLEGRRTGEPGADAASEYLAKQFKDLKLLPMGTSKGSFFQPFPYVTGVELAAKGNEFAIQSGAGPIDAQDARPAGFSANAAIASAQVVFAGFGIVSPEAARDDYAGVDPKGKVVLVFDGGPEMDNPHSPFGRLDARTKALIARDKGAVGLLIVTREASVANDKLARLSFDQTLGESALPTMVISRPTAAAILRADAKDLDGIEAGRSRPVGIDGPITIKLGINLVKKTSDARNVIGVLPGKDPVLKDEAIVIGAHYDHLGRGGQGSLDLNSSEVHHGADDNASGTAAILELARQFAAERSNKRTLIFIAFSGEEEGLLGSQYYVNHPLFPLDKTVAMINLDMVGRLNAGKLNIGGVGTSAEWKDLIAQHNSSGNAAGVPGTPLFQLQLTEDGFGPSDHSSFYGKKMPVLFFFTGTHNDYHKPSDTSEKINYSGLENITSFVGGIVRSVDQGPARPSFTLARSAGMGGGRTGFSVSLGTVPNYADSTDGLQLDGVRDNSPAAQAGILAGDKIVKLAGKDIRNVMDYTYVLGEMKAGTEYEVVVLRGGDRVTLKIIPVKR